MSTASGVATRNATALFPDAQLATRALAAISALGCGAKGTTGVAVVGTGGGAVVVVVGAWVVVVLGADVVVGRVVGGDAWEELHAAADRPTTATQATVRKVRAGTCVTFPL